MDAIEYLTEKARMTKKCTLFNCEGCGLSTESNKHYTMCRNFESTYPDKAIAIVEEWSKAHPRKVYMDDFLEKFPDSILNQSRYYICRDKVYNMGKQSTGNQCESKFKGDCEECWNEFMG